MRPLLSAVMAIVLVACSNGGIDGDPNDDPVVQELRAPQRCGFFQDWYDVSTANMRTAGTAREFALYQARAAAAREQIEEYGCQTSLSPFTP